MEKNKWVIENATTLNNVLRYILYDTPGYEDDQLGRELVQWAAELQGELKKDTSPLDLVCRFHTPVVKQLYSVLRECLLSHRWKSALQMMTAVAQEHANTQQTMFRVGLCLFHQDDTGSERLLEQLLKHLARLNQLNAKEVFLELVFYLLSRRHFAEAHDVHTNSQKSHHLRRFNQAKDRQILDVTYKAYDGLLCYMEWLQAKHRLAVASSHETDMKTLSSMDMGHEEYALRVIAEKAVTSLKVAENKPGVMDIFVTKHVELLRFLDMSDEAEEVLKKYAADNSNNPNAWKYLCHFYREEQRTAEYHETLQDVAGLLPGDPLVLDLYKYNRTKDDASLSLPLLFSLLDFPGWQQETEPWKLLAEDLMLLLKKSPSPSTQDAVEEAWSERQSWWPSYHFLPDSVQTHARHGVQALKYRAIVAAVFGVNESFVEKVTQQLEGEEKSLLMTSLAEARLVANRWRPVSGDG